MEPYRWRCLTLTVLWRSDGTARSQVPSVIFPILDHPQRQQTGSCTWLLPVHPDDGQGDFCPSPAHTATQHGEQSQSLLCLTACSFQWECEQFCFKCHYHPPPPPPPCCCVGCGFLEKAYLMPSRLWASLSVTRDKLRFACFKYWSFICGFLPFEHFKLWAFLGVAH